MKTKITIIVLLSFLFLNQSYSQKYFTIKMKYPKELGDSMTCLLLKITNTFYFKRNVENLKDSITYFANQNDSNVTICRYQILQDSE